MKDPRITTSKLTYRIDARISFFKSLLVMSTAAVPKDLKDIVEIAIKELEWILDQIKEIQK